MENCYFFSTSARQRRTFFFKQNCQPKIKIIFYYKAYSNSLEAVLVAFNSLDPRLSPRALGSAIGVPLTSSESTRIGSMSPRLLSILSDWYKPPSGLTKWTSWACGAIGGMALNMGSLEGLRRAKFWEYSGFTWTAAPSAEFASIASSSVHAKQDFIVHIFFKETFLISSSDWLKVKSCF